MKNLRNSYKYYKQKANAAVVDIKVYLKIAALYNKFLIRKVIEGETITFPERMGILSVKGKKVKPRFDEEGNVLGLAPDWVKTKEYWNSNPKAKEKKKLIYHTNDHTNGVRYKYIWSKARVLVTNKTLYSLKLTRGNKRALSKKIKGGKEYLMI